MAKCREKNASISQGWDSASEWYRARVLESSGVKEAGKHAKQNWKDLPINVKRIVTGKPVRNSFDTPREKAAYAAGLQRGGAGLGSALGKLRSKRARRVERMMRSGLGRKNPSPPAELVKKAQSEQKLFAGHTVSVVQRRDGRWELEYKLRKGRKNPGEERRAIIAAYKARGVDAVTGKGGGFALKGRGYVSLAKARKETGISMAHSRGPRMEALPWGDYATVAALSGRLKR